MRVYVNTFAKGEVPAVGDVEGSLNENSLPDRGEKRSELGCTGTTQCWVHGGVTPAGLPRGIAQRLELGRHAGIPTSVGHFGQRCGRRTDAWYVRSRLAVTQSSIGQLTHGESVAEEDRRLRISSLCLRRIGKYPGVSRILAKVEVARAEDLQHLAEGLRKAGPPE